MTTPNPNPPRKSNTLTIVLIIVAVVAVLAAILIGILVFAGSFLLRTGIDQAQTSRVEADLATLKMSLTMYRTIGGSNPTTQQGLSALVERPTAEPMPERWKVLIEEVPLDPWGRPYQYASPATRSDDDYDLWSFGPDGIDGTADDLGNVRTAEPR